MTRRDLYLRRKYGITSEDYEKMLKKGRGACWICRRPPTNRRLAVDHCHRTGKVRGLLCWRCNRGLQFYKDNPTLFLRATLYLKGELWTDQNLRKKV